MQHRRLIRAAIPVVALAVTLTVVVVPAASAKLPAKGRGPGLDVAQGHSGQPLTSGSGSGSTAEGPGDFIAMKDTLSQPDFPEIVTESLHLDTFDGEEIYLEITKPDPAVYGEMQLPVILEASPYHGTIATRIGDRVFPDPRDPEGNFLGLTGYFAPRGYAVVMMDLRGTGRSSGCLDHLGPNDAKDMKVVIEWAAKQPWSNGRVGMTGHSYVGSTPSVAAALRPKGLVTIVPSAGLASMYDHQYQMGVPYLLQWAGPQWAYELLALSRHLPPGLPTSIPLVGSSPLGQTGDDFGNHPTNTGCGMQNSAFTAGSGQVTGQYELWHARRDWGDLAADADIPIFMVHGVNDNAARIPAAEWFFKNRFNRPGDKIWLGQNDHGSAGPSRCAPARTAQYSTGHVTCRFDQWQYAVHAWFDKHLMQRDVDTGPPVEVFLNREEPLPVATNGNFDPFAGGSKVFTADSWTRPDVRTELYLDASGATNTLSFEPPEQNGSRTFTSNVNAVAAWTNPVANLTFESQPLERDTLYVGLPRLLLNTSMSNPVHLTVQLFREDADGNREAINTCAIQPLVRDGVETLSPVVPGQEMDLRPQCFTMAHWIPAGQHLEVEVAVRTSHHASWGAGQITVHTGPGKSHFLLPERTDFALYDDVALLEG